jgi:hypothetical protein
MRGGGRRRAVGRGSGGGRVARAKKRKKKQSRAYRFFLLAALTLLIAGFIARHEIPLLIRNSRRPAPAHVSEDRENFPDLAAPGGNLHPPVVSEAADDRARRLADHLKNDLRARQSPPHDELTGAERQRLGDLIKERSR